VPVPSSPAAVRRRGYDATWTMAVRAARRLRPDLDVIARHWLAQRRAVRDQAGLDAAERAANLRGSLRARVAAADRLVAIIDDVVTTGSSLAEAHRALRRAGADVLGAATVAATRRRSAG
jgi:predicted amidophosphoribosyltransferase